MKAQGQNLIMVDFVLQDKRSTGAMLRGEGDGRERMWLELHEKKRHFLSEEELYFLYPRHCELLRVTLPENTFLKKALIAVGVLLVIGF